ncbi:type I polyketide synthase [Nocardia jejuensis]|uniref:type I polyketide synthase n=1 Tax=Nocardia jejuensis TaxID=328049 RepID=UPI0009FC4FA8|nr:type I polyketide synthase [Nocardia jejuensis]
MQHSGTQVQQWLRGGPLDSTEQQTLVVFPHAGGGATFYRPWLDNDNFSVRIVQYPGREDRISEPRPSNLNALADGVAEALSSAGDRPICLFGHSMGALVAFEVAHRLEATGRGNPLRLCVSSYTPPHLPRTAAPQDMNDETLLAHARFAMGETGAFDNPALRALVISGLRADFQMLAQYRTDPEPRLNAPILALRGAEEPIAATDMDAWAQLTRSSCRSLTLPGGHFYLIPEKTAVLDTVHRWCAELDQSTHPVKTNDTGTSPLPQDNLLREDDIAVIGLAARVPGAADLEEFWRNLCTGTESLTQFTDEQLRSAGVGPSQLEDPRLVRARPILAEAADFDATFFGYAPSEARLIDPQQRLFLECAWEAVESAGYDLPRYDGAISVFAGGSGSTYYRVNLRENSAHLEAAGYLQTTLSTENDFLAPRVSYKLNLRGPSISLGTGCSTSLVATHLAVQSILSGESDMALAGGACITFPQHAGYVAASGEAISPTGRCRAFDAEADGTILGDGVGVILLKRATQAVHDGDTILGIIKGTAVNNDGAHKAGFAAPSITGQAQVIAEALAVADVPAETIDYVETHGTGTPIGDPVEIAALTDAFRHDGDTRTASCRLGTLKPNIGHTGPASGILGLIKVLLAFRHRTYPPATNYTVPNPQIDLPRTPFYIGSSLRAWHAPHGKARRATVSAYSMGGTNAHVVLQEPPPVSRTTDPAPNEPQLLLLSARTPQALATTRKNLARHLARHPEHNLASVAATLRIGRRAFTHRFAAVCIDSAHAQAALDGIGPTPSLSGIAPGTPSPVAFLFPGQGSQFSGMGAHLYATSPMYRRHIDECADSFEPLIGMDLRTLLCDAVHEAADISLRHTSVTQPALFTVAYALTRLLDHCGVQPVAMLGHSIGELVAACVAGVFTLEQAIELVALRGDLMQHCEPGSMAALEAPLDTVTAMLPEGVSVAAINAPQQIVATGSAHGVDELLTRATAINMRCTRLPVNRAFHSALLDPVAERFTAAAARMRLRPPQCPFLSNVSGTWITETQAIDPTYWGRQLRETVQFAAGLTQLRTDYPEALLVEVGPGHTLRGLVAMNAPGTEVVSTLGGRSGDSAVAAATAAARLWVAGVQITWPHPEPLQRIPLPTYPFQRERLWIGPSSARAHNAPDTPAPDMTEPAIPNSEIPADSHNTTVDQIWCEALGMSSVQPRDNFFDLGGNSLIAARIVTALEHRCQVQVSVAELWDQGATLGDLADLVAHRRHNHTTGNPHLVPDDTAGRDTPDERR